MKKKDLHFHPINNNSSLFFFLKMSVPFMKCFPKSVFHTNQQLFTTYLHANQQKNYITYLCCVRQTYGISKVSPDIQHLLLYQIASNVISKYCKDEFPTIIEYMYFWFHEHNLHQWNPLVIMKDCPEWSFFHKAALMGIYFNNSRKRALDAFFYDTELQTHMDTLMRIYDKESDGYPLYYGKSPLFIGQICSMSSCEGSIVPNVKYYIPMQPDLLIGMIIEDDELQNIESITLLTPKKDYELVFDLPIVIKALSFTQDEDKKTWSISQHKLYYFEGLDATRICKTYNSRSIYVKQRPGKTIDMNRLYTVDSYADSKLHSDIVRLWPSD